MHYKWNNLFKLTLLNITIINSWSWCFFLNIKKMETRLFHWNESNIQSTRCKAKGNLTTLEDTRPLLYQLWSNLDVGVFWWLIVFQYCYIVVQSLFHLPFWCAINWCDFYLTGLVLSGTSLPKKYQFVLARWGTTLSKHDMDINYLVIAILTIHAHTYMCIYAYLFHSWIRFLFLILLFWVQYNYFISCQ